MTVRLSISVGAVMHTANLVAMQGTTEVRLLEQLTYLGQNGTSFRVGYREFGDGSARTGYYENVVYQNPKPDQPTEITYRNTRIMVYAATNSKIEFEILSSADHI